MRIALDARAIGPRLPGISRATLGLLRGLAEAQHDHRVTVLHHASDRALLDAVADDERFELVTRTHGEFDVWHAPYYVRPLTGLPPVVVTAYDLISPRTAVARMKWAIRMRASLKLAAHVIAISVATRDELIRELGLARVTVVPLAADARFRPGAAAGDRYVLYVGTNKPHKNVDALIGAWKRVKRASSADGVSLVIAGHEDPRCLPWRERFAGVESVRFLRDVADADLPSLMSGAMSFVFPSLREGFGLPPLEAMASGTPVLASNRASIPEVVGDAGLLVEPNEQALAKGLSRLLSDDALRAELRRRGLARAAQFSWRRTAEETLAVYARVAGRS